MPRRKNAEIAHDDVLRRFLLQSLKDVAKDEEVELDAKEEADYVEALVESIGDGLVATIKGTALFFINNDIEEAKK